MFFDLEKAARDLVESNDYLTRLYNDLVCKDLKDYRAKDYEKYFTVRDTPKRGRKVTPKEEATDEQNMNHGFFALLSNEVRDPPR